MPTRRTFIKATAMTLGGAAALTGRTYAQPARIEESDPAATALGYRHDATKVDKARFAKYQAGQTCANCALYQGKASDPWAPCAIVAGKLVAGRGWCSAWVKKTG